MSLAPQLRTDPISGRQVLISPERAARPGALTPRSDELPSDAADCPLCEGREQLTPPELYALRDTGAADTPGWRVRVVPNRYPAVRDPLGTHELIVECPVHETSLENLAPGQVETVLRTYRERLAARRAEGRWRYAQLFKNHGVAAGASLAHAHAQLVALPAVPPALAVELPACAGRCAFCELIGRELAEGDRVIATTPAFVAVATVAGRLPFETWVLPRRHGNWFEDSGDDTELAALLVDVLRRLDAAAGRPAYNLYLHNGPWDATPFHWHFELLPRLTGVAGFEWGAGMFINPLPPEDAAARLRAVHK